MKNHQSRQRVRPRVSGLYAIADTAGIALDQLFLSVQQAIAGGARVIQFRDKNGLQTKNQLARARTTAHVAQLAELCHQHGILFIVNDDIALALAVQADGVHLGRDDTPLGQARLELEPGKIIGVSCYNEIERALAAQASGASYVAFGSFFPSRTKPAAVPASLSLLRQARARIRLPIVAIGGIRPDNAAPLIAAGADAVAAVTGVFEQKDVRAAARAYAQLFISPAGEIP